MISTLKHLAYTLKVRTTKLEKVILHIDEYYYEKKELKLDNKGNVLLDKSGNEKFRILNPSIKQLKTIQKRIRINILSKLHIPDYAFGGIKGRDNIKNAKCHQGKKYVFTTDLKNFYPTFRNERVFEMFRSFHFSPTVAKVLTQLTTYKGRLPQGAPTSSTIANLVFIKTGKKLQLFSIENKLTFTSFVDDLAFSAPYDFKGKIPVLLETIKSDCYSISHKKTNYKTKNPIVTNLVVKNNKLELPNSFKVKLVNTEGYSQAQINGLKLYQERVLMTNK